MQFLWDYAKTDSAVHQRIRCWARRDNLVAMRRKGRWYFADYDCRLESPESGLDDAEALLWLQDALVAVEKGGAR
jgi:hypothetical protein